MLDINDQSHDHAHAVLRPSAEPSQGGGFLFLGNDRCLDFLNTRIARHDRLVELLDSFDDLLRWLAAAGVLAPERAAELAAKWQATPAADAALRAARALRADLLALVDHLIAGEDPPPATVAALNTVLRERSSYEQLVARDVPAAAAEGAGTGGPRWRRERSYVPHAPRDVLAPLTEAAVTLLCEREPARIKRCANPTCVLRFYDTSKNGARSWCDTRTCGNRVRAARFYRRQRAAAPGRSV
ncbi:MAG TPA: CGNR zinc finger domain-containing protein [Ktedonobacterales bacterium]|nr:CGNR zinc finger domain-containing protein [Ktedonobacterales bacterium]